MNSNYMKRLIATIRSIATFATPNSSEVLLVDRRGIEPRDADLARISRYPIDAAHKNWHPAA